jgi:hypothetical protein
VEEAEEEEIIKAVIKTKTTTSKIKSTRPLSLKSPMLSGKMYLV